MTASDRRIGFLFISMFVVAIAMMSLAAVNYIGYLLGDDIPMSARIKIVPVLCVVSGIIVLVGYKILSYLFGGLS